MNHREAFCLMKYRCTSGECGYIETIWNSRDGVTPFGLNCKKCGEPANHIDWNQDVPFHDFWMFLCKEFFQDTRVFISMTKEKAEGYAKKRLESFKGTEYPPPDSGTAEYTELFNAVVADIYHNGESPDVITGEEFAKCHTTKLGK